jgi:site-specific DNA recombinase
MVRARVCDEAERAGAKLVFVTEGLDSTPEGQMMQSVRGYVTEVERQKIKERTSRGKRARLLAGLDLFYK